MKNKINHMFTKTREINNLAIADSGTTGLFITSEAICQNKKESEEWIVGNVTR